MNWRPVIEQLKRETPEADALTVRKTTQTTAAFNWGFRECLREVEERLEEAEEDE